MRDPRATVRTPRRLASGVCALAFLLILVVPATAQEEESGGPLRFLKPWIERQLFGRETSEPGAGLAPATAPAEGVPPVGELEPDQALPQGGAPGEPTSDSQAPATPEEENGTALRGSAPPSDTAVAETPAPNVPPADPAETAETVDTKPEALRFAVLAGRSVAATMAAVGPVAEELAAILGRPVEILPLASYGAMIDAQAQRRIDGGFYSAAAFAAADVSCACLEPVVAPRASDGTLAYHAVIVARASAGIASVADLVDKTVAIGAADSIGARRMQLAGLLSEGVDPATAFGAVLQVESAEEAVRLVAGGAADAAFAWSSLAGRVESGYSRGTLTELVSGGAIAMDALTVIWRSPAIAHSPFAVMRTLAEEDKGKIEKYLVSLSAANPAAYDMLDRFYGGGYAPVDPQDYGGLETLLAENVDALHLPGGPATTGATATPPAEAPPALAAPPQPN